MIGQSAPENGPQVMQPQFLFGLLGTLFNRSALMRDPYQIGQELTDVNVFP